MKTRRGICRQRGAALFAALFLLIVVAALGSYAARLGVKQDHAASLQLLQVRAEAAAMSGLEFAANRARANSCPAGPTPVSLLAAPELSSFVVEVRCTSIAVGAQRVYELSASAVTAAAPYGSPDFVQRTLRRRVGIW